MQQIKHRIWSRIILLTVTALFGISIAGPSQALADKKGKGQSEEWKQNKEDDKEYRKKKREQEREERKKYEEQDREERNYNDEQERERRKYLKEQEGEQEI